MIKFRYYFSACTGSLTRVLHVVGVSFVHKRDAKDKQFILDHFHATNSCDLSVRSTHSTALRVPLGVVDLMSIDAQHSLLHAAKLVLLHHIPLLVHRCRHVSKENVIVQLLYGRSVSVRANLPLCGSSGDGRIICKDPEAANGVITKE